MSNLPEAKSMDELLLKAIAEGTKDNLPEARSRLQVYLKYIAMNANGNYDQIEKAVNELNDIVGYDNAAAHNSIYRGKNLGTQFTAEMSANIKNGTFKDLYCGDYLVINGTTYRFMDLDYLYKTGDTSLETHHILVVPDEPMYNHVMNDTNTTEGGYVGSKVYTSVLDQALAKIKADFGESHIVTYRTLLVNATSNGIPSNWAW